MRFALATVCLGLLLAAPACRKERDTDEERRGAPGMMGCPGMSAGGVGALMAWMNEAELDGSPTEPRPLEDDALRALGARLYRDRCAMCHGERGDGKGHEARRLSVPPRDFAAGVFKLRSTPSGSLPTDEDLFRTISRGIHGTAMMPWVVLTERERWALAAHVKALSPDFAEEAPAQPVPVPDPPPETPELVERGRVVYERAKCADCHGTTGRGDGPAAALLRDDADRPIRPRSFGDGRFRRGTTMKDLYLTLRTGLDGTPMGSYADALAPEDTWAVAAYVRTFLPPPPRGGMMCPMMSGAADPEERLGMMICMPGMPHGMGGMP